MEASGIPYEVYRVNPPDEARKHALGGDKVVEERRQRVVLHAVTSFPDGPAPRVIGAGSLPITLRGDDVGTLQEGDVVQISVNW